MSASIQPDCLIYYGTEIPDPTRTRALSGAYVVLQPYHSVCTEGLYEEFFPNCRRYLYWNPSRVYRSEWNREAHDLPSLGFDSRWNTLLLDLSAQRSRDYVVAAALQCLRTPGVHGLFVDDLDSWAMNSSQKEVIASILAEIEAKAGREFAYFVNRGFHFWPKIKNLDAVLLEGISPSTVRVAQASEASWLEGILKLHLKTLKARGGSLPIFGLSYEAETQADTPSAHEALASEFDRVLNKSLVLPRNLAQWPETLRC